MDTSNSPPNDARYRLDFSSHSCRIRIDGAKPGKEVKVLVKDLQQADAPVLHGLGVRSDDGTQFTAQFTSVEGPQTLVREWEALRAEIGTYPRYD